MNPTPWLHVPRPLPDAAARLLILPHSGGHAAAFRGWEARVPARVELLLAYPPGRGVRLREPPIRHHETLLSALYAALEPRLDRPLVVAGHSLGARVALALAHRFRALGAPGPAALVVSARPGPAVPRRGAPLHPLPRAAFLDELERRYGALDAALRHPELAEMVFPSLQADLQLSETWPDEPGPPLDCPLHARGGAADPSVSREDLEAWRRETRGPSTVEQLPGGHFYLLHDPGPFFASIRGVLERAAADG